LVCPALFSLSSGEKEEIDMRRSINVGQVLKSKEQGFWYVAPTTTVYEALEIMADKNVGALLVVEGGQLMGMFSERDYARKVILKGKSSKNTEVRELMSSPPICIGPEQSIHECMVLMTNNHIRHVPVIDPRGLMGVVSIGDIVNSIISDQETTIEELESYITVGY
jgi:signal-transduction protein with cAMP-binding, CBS, and nucleotidyltransferase domain